MASTAEKLASNLNFVEIKILDKVSSKTSRLTLNIQDELRTADDSEEEIFFIDQEEFEKEKDKNYTCDQYVTLRHHLNDVSKAST